jgi:4-diphosphocytidyl-2-C-methyl-D-erythritol kinase
VSATAATVEAQAKLNLRLCVLARGADGYHQLETLFIRIELADSVRVATDTATKGLTCDGLDLPPEQNLAWRAAEAFLAETRWNTGFQIGIEKRIPSGGGLGGGSADAGAVLRALNALAPTPLSSSALLTLALRLGADVPFLATDAPLALGWGRGERLLALRPLPAREVLLALPPFGVETKAAFGWYATAAGAGSTVPRAPAPLSLDALDRWDAIAPLAVNDLEEVVIARHPDIGTCVKRLHDAGARIARMSGSGSTAFGVFDRRPSVSTEGFPEGVRLVPTRTATSVAPIKLLD